MIIDAVKKQEATSKQEYIVEDNNKQNQKIINNLKI